MVSSGYRDRVVCGRRGWETCTSAGTLSKGSGTFKIDHPLDPANKYLSHSFVESPDMMNIYNGNVATDARRQGDRRTPRLL